MFGSACAEAHPAEKPAAKEPTVGELRRSIFNLVWPATVESVLQMGVGLVNTAMVGHLSALAIGTVGLCSRATMIGFVLFQGIGTGATVLVAQAIGSRNEEKARTVAVQGLFFAVASVMVLGAAFSTWAAPVLRIFGPAPDLLAASVMYLRIIVLGMPAQGIMMSAGAAMRGSGDTRTPMMVALSVNLLNIAGNYALIYGHFGFPALGIRGAAMATVTAQWTGAFLALVALTSKNSKLGLTWRGPWKLDRTQLGRMLAIGMPASGEWMFWQSAHFVLALFITGFGTTTLAAHHLGMQAESISYMPTAGFSMAAMTLVGQAVGGRNLRLAQRSARELINIAAAITAVTGGMLLFLPRQILTALTNDAGVIALGVVYLRLMATAQIPQQLTGVLSGVLRGSGDTRTPMVIAAVGQWGIRLPLAYILAFPLKMGIVGVWMGMTADIFARFGLIFFRYKRISWAREPATGLAKQVSAAV